MHRDFGGFDIDFGYRRKKHLALPAQMTTIGTLEKDYKISSDPARPLRKLDSFFWGGLAFNLDKDLPQWSKDGLLRGPGQLKKGDVKRMLEHELVDQYHRLTGRKVRLGGDFRNVTRMLAARKPAREPLRQRLKSAFRRLSSPLQRLRRALRRRPATARR